MNRETLALALVQLYFIVSVPLLLMLGAARVAMMPAFLRFEYTRPGFPSDPYEFTTEDRLAYGKYGIEFLFNNEDVSFLAELRLPIEKCWQPASGSQDCALFEARELNHMRDVKVIARSAYTLALGLAAVAAIILILMFRKRAYRHAILQGLFIGSLATLAFLATGVTLVVAAWDLVFDAFHELFFAAGTWRFPYSDSLIRLYPEQLFVDAAILTAALMSAGAALLVLLSRRYRGSLT